MKKRYLILLSLLIFSLTTATANLFLEVFTIRFYNESDSSVKITLNGTIDYTETLPTGQSSVKVDEGTYDYSYTSCGVEHTGQITVDEDNYPFEINYCSWQSVDSSVVIGSHFGINVVVNLVNQDNDYTLETELGRNVYNEIKSGVYAWSHDGCDFTVSGFVVVPQDGFGAILLKGCDVITFNALLDELGLVKPNPVKFTMRNWYSTDISVTLIGPLVYYETLTPGTHEFTVLSGTYQYIYAWNNVRYSGIVVVGQLGISALSVPIPVFSGIE